jgi:hypothetical protein
VYGVSTLRCGVRRLGLTGARMRDIGQLLFFVGLALAAIGLLAWVGALSWFGRLPGDIRIASDNVRVYIPITSMLLVSLVSLVMTLLLSVFRR